MLAGDSASAGPLAVQQDYRMFHDIYILLDSGDRRLLSRFNLTTSQYNALMLLDAYSGMRLITLAERLLLDKSTVTRLVDQLAGAGLVERIADPDDRRAQRVVLTPHGIERRGAAYAAHQEWLRQRLGVLSEDEQSQLHALLGKLRESLRKDLGIAIDL